MSGQDFEVGNAVLKVAPDFGEFIDKLKAGLAAINEHFEVLVQPKFERFAEEVAAYVRTVQEANTVNLEARINTAEASERTAAWRDREEENTFSQRATANMSEASADAAAFRARQEANPITIRARVVGENAARQSVRDRLDPNSDLETRLGLLRDESALHDDINRATISGDNNRLAAASEELRLRRQISSAMSAQAREDNNEDSSGARKNFRVVQGFQGVSLFNLANITAAAMGISLIVAELGGAVAAAGAAATALGAVGASVLVGGMGVFKVFQDLKQANNSAAGNTKDTAKEQREALDKVHDAQKAVADGARDLARDQARVGDAVRDTTRELRDMSTQLEDSKLSQEDAAIGVARAKERLSQVRFDRRNGDASALDEQEATVGVRRAQNSLLEAQNDYSDKKIDSAVARKKGVQGSDKVVDARQQVADDVVKLAKAQRELTEAQVDAAKAGTITNAAQERFNELMKKLSPNARDFVNQVRSLGGEWKKLQTAVQDRLFAGLGADVSRVAKTQFPELQRGMVQMAGVANSVFRDTLNTVSATFTQFSQDGTFTKFLNAVQESFKGFAPVIDAVVRALTGLTIGIGPALGNMFQELARFINEGTPFWSEFGRIFVEQFTKMLPLVNRIFNALAPLMRVLMPLLTRALDEFTQVLEQNSGRLASLGTNFGDAFVHAIQILGPLVPPLADALSLLFNAFTAIPPGVIAPLLAMTIISRSLLSPLLGLSNAVGRMGALFDNFGAAAQRMSRFTQGLRGNMATAADGTASFGNRIGRALNSAATTTATGIRTMFSNIGSAIATASRTAASGASRAWGGITSAASTAATGMRTALVNSATAIRGAMITTATATRGAMVAAAGGMQRAFAFLVALPGRILASRAAMLLASAAAKVWTGVQWLLNAALTANPIGLVVVAIAALAAGIYLAWKNSSTFRDIVMSCWNWIKKYWDILVFGLGPIGMIIGAVVQLVKHWDDVKNAVGAAIDWVVDKWKSFQDSLTNGVRSIKNGLKNLFSPITDSFRDAINWVIKAWNNFQLRFRFTIPIINKKVDWTINTPNIPLIGGKSGAYSTGGPVMAGRNGDGTLVGPGNGTDDQIIGVDANGIPTARVSNGEGVVNEASMQKHPGLFHALNNDAPWLDQFADLPRFDSGGVVGGKFDAKAFNDSWSHFFQLWAGGNTADTRDVYLKSHQNVNSLYRTGQRPPADSDMKFNTAWDAFFQAKIGVNYGKDNLLDGYWAKRPDLKTRYDDHQLPPSGIDEKNALVAFSNREARYNTAWSKYLDSKVLNGNLDANRDMFFKRNPDIAERYRSGHLPPGQDDSFILTPGQNQPEQPDDSGSGDAPPVATSGDQTGSFTPADTPDTSDVSATGGVDPNSVQLSAREAEQLGGAPIATSMWKVIKAKFPTATLGSAKTDHGVDGGYHPEGEAIDIGGPMQDIANFIFSDLKDQTAQLIYGPGPLIYNVHEQNHGGVANITDQKQLRNQVYAEDLPGHYDHVHWAAEKLINTPASMLPQNNGAGTDSAAGADTGSDGPISTDGFDDVKPGSGSSSDANDLYDNLSIPGAFSKAGGIIGAGVLDFFGLGGSILSDSNVYNKAVQDGLKGVYDAGKSTVPKDYNSLYERFIGAQAKPESGTSSKKDKPMSDAVGDGSPNTSQTDNLLGVPGQASTPAAPAGGASNPYVHTYDPSQGVEQWRPVMEAVFKLGGFPSSLIEPGLKQMNTESGGNPKAQNNTDSNAQKGTPSKSLMQVIQPTFDAYKSPKLKDDIWDPANNIFAGTNYGVHRYPDLASVWGAGHGYADGGPVVGPGGPRDDAIAARLSHGEYVINEASTAAAGSALDFINQSPGNAAQVAQGIAFMSAREAGGLVANRPTGIGRMNAPLSRPAPAPSSHSQDIHTGDITGFSPKDVVREFENLNAKRGFSHLVGHH